MSRLAASPSKTFLLVLTAFVAGIAAHAASERSWGATLPMAGAAAPLLVAVSAARRAPVPRLLLLCVAAAAVAIVRYDAALAALPSSAELAAGEARFEGVLASEPRLGVDGTVLLMDRVFVSGAAGPSPIGARMEVRVRLPLEAHPGDRFRWSCRPAALDASLADAAVFLRHVGWRCWPRILPERAATGGSGLRRLSAAAKSRLRDAAGAFVPEPSSALLLGLLVGDKDGLPRDVSDAFRRTGTAHVLAVSGYNVSRLVEAFIIVFAFVGIARRRAAAPVAVCIVAFAAFVGAEASVVRAAVMGCAGVLASALGRRYHGMNAFMLAAAAMLMAQPLLLRHDAGFRLSFAAVAGLHAFGPPLARRLRFLPETLGIRSSCAETLGATLTTLPLVLRDFGILPVMGPLVNVVIAPFVPAAMGVGFLTVALSALPPIAALPAVATDVLLRALVAAVVVSSRTFPVLEARVGAVGMMVLYAWLLLLWFGLHRADEQERSCENIR